MGYELHITRADDYLDRATSPISREEWDAFATGEAGLTIGGWIDWEDIGRQPVYAYTSSDGHEFSLHWRDGEALVKGHFSDQARQELARLAEGLKANLIGDENEKYTAAAPRPTGWQRLTS